MGVYETKIGTLLVGIVFNTFLYGLVTYQFVVYYRTKFNDGTILRYMVFFLFILDTVHSISAIYLLWYYTVVNFGNLGSFARSVWPYPFTPLGTALVALVAQLFLGYRIWRLTNSKFLYGVVIVMAIPTFILGLTCSVMAFVIKLRSELPRITPFATSWLTMQVITDAFITVNLVVIFVRWRGGCRKTDTVLNRLIRGAIQTGLFAGLFALGDMITFIVSPDTNFYGMFAFPIGRIYTNTLMDTLLARESITEEMDSTRDLGRISGPLACLPGDSMSTVASEPRIGRIKMSKEISHRSSDERARSEVVQVSIC